MRRALRLLTTAASSSPPAAAPKESTTPTAPAVVVAEKVAEYARIAANYKAPLDLTEQRFGLPKELVEQRPEAVRRVCGLENTGSASERRQAERLRVAAEHRKHPFQTHGAVAAASLCMRIQTMLKLCLENRRDRKMREDLQKLVGHRRRILKYLRENDFEAYWRLCQQFGLWDALAMPNPSAHRHGKWYSNAGGLKYSRNTAQAQRR
eukprot:TRINITY_DN8122_c0_g1_i1.p1 TRINITY_DN8122_c0_g1~~TRINITY_DN8122_c0_g1_i1.p1  ORF type:complete len:208 (+),score=41.11 TRINITY_DN8122_c0_g1_i1:98-721(+)